MPIENSSDEVRLKQVREMRLRPRAERNARGNLARSNGKKAIEGGATKKTVASIPNGCDEIEEIVRDCLMGHCALRKDVLAVDLFDGGQEVASCENGGCYRPGRQSAEAVPERRVSAIRKGPADEPPNCTGGP